MKRNLQVNSYDAVGPICLAAGGPIAKLVGVPKPSPEHNAPPRQSTREGRRPRETPEVDGLLALSARQGLNLRRPSSYAPLCASGDWCQPEISVGFAPRSRSTVTVGVTLPLR